MPLHGYGRGGGPRNSSKHMPHDIYASLSPRAQRICRYLPADPGEEIKGLGVMHPWTCVREEATGVEWNENGRLPRDIARIWAFVQECQQCYVVADRPPDDQPAHGPEELHRLLRPHLQLCSKALSLLSQTQCVLCKCKLCRLKSQIRHAASVAH